MHSNEGHGPSAVSDYPEQISDTTVTLAAAKVWFASFFMRMLGSCAELPWLVTLPHAHGNMREDANKP